jgi:uncharacterized protein YndB with AHSA1/START domain
MVAEGILTEALIRRSCSEVWKLWTGPKHIVKWNSATEDWHCPRAENNLSAGGKFSYRMESRDGAVGYDFRGVYDEFIQGHKIAYTLDDGRKAEVTFTPAGNGTGLRQVFEPEQSVSADMQRAGWQSILDTFKAYAESL